MDREAIRERDRLRRKKFREEQRRYDGDNSQAMTIPNQARAIDNKKSWRERAACKEKTTVGYYDPFSLDRQRKTTVADFALAMSRCIRCEVWQECLNYSCDAREEYGLWGGVPVSQRQRMFTAESEVRIERAVLIRDEWERKNA